MRAYIFAVALVAGCTPDITSGAYDCGSQESCPEGLKCNPGDGTCVNASLVEPFACDPQSVPSTFDLPDLGCAGTYMGKGCLPAGDTANWMKLSVGATCSTRTLHVSVAFPIAFEPLGADLEDSTGNQQLATDDVCSQGFVGTSEDQRCVVAQVQGGTDYMIQVRPAGGNDCGGTCNFNQYNVTVQLAAQ